MSGHYTDFVNKSISAKEIVFEKIKDEDRELVKNVHLRHIKANIALLIPLGLVFAMCLIGFIKCVTIRHRSLFVDVLTIAAFAFGVGLTAYCLWSILGPVRLMRKGVVISHERIREMKDKRNGTFQYIFDIYLEDLDRTLMSYQVKKEVYEDIEPGDGVVLFKSLGKIKVLADPGRKGVMDVSRIKSGVDFKLSRRE